MPSVPIMRSATAFLVGACLPEPEPDDTPAAVRASNPLPVRQAANRFAVASVVVVASDRSSAPEPVPTAASGDEQAPSIEASESADVSIAIRRTRRV